MNTIEVELDLLASTSDASDVLFNSLLFEHADDETLKIAENIMKHYVPGNYELTKWVTPSNCRGDLVLFNVMVRFPSKEDFVLFRLQWG